MRPERGIGMQAVQPPAAVLQARRLTLGAGQVVAHEPARCDGLG